MLKRFGFSILAIVIIFSLVLSGCSGSSKTDNKSGPPVSSTAIAFTPRGLTGSISTGKTVAAASVPVSPSGGTISVTESGTPITGLELKVPSGSYKDKRDFKISYAPIEKHSFGEEFNPITPLIIVENGGEYSAEDMLITLPVKIPEGKFAMGFLYNEKTKILEGMPLMAESANSITVSTRHFSSFIISIIDKFKLKKDIDTSFRPGIDDWQFVNKGSYITTGHCAGQSVSAMWYYYNQPDGKDLTLYGRYDNNGKQPATPGFQEDDSLGYRLASVIQEDLDWDSWASQFFAEQRGVDDELAWDAFAYSMQFLKQPCYVGMDSVDGGHAMICYRIKNGNLYVADPNYPGNTERRIEYINNKFKPYESGANFEEIQAGNSTSYTKIGYVAQSSRVDWNKMTQRWQEFKNKTIGNDKFPAYTVTYKDEKGQYQELKDGYISTSNLIDINNKANFPNSITVFRDGKVVPFDASGNLELKPGNNQLGIYIRGIINPQTANEEKKYVDFQYFSVIFGGLNLKPAQQEAEPNRNLTFNLELTEPAPKDSKFEWYVDGTLKKTGTDFSIQVSFPGEGQHTVVAKIVDSKGKAVLQAQGIANIKIKPTASVTLASNLSALQKMQYMRVAVKGKWSQKTWLASGETTKDSLFTYNIPWYPQPKDPDLAITWSGTSFSGKNEGSRGKGEVKGTVSADGKVLTSLEWVYTDWNDNGTTNSPWKTETTTIIKLQNVPIPQLVFERATEDKFTTSKNGADVKNYITEISYRSVTYRNGQKESEVISVPNSIKWDATDFQGQPSLNVSFEVNRAFYPGG
jgi:hypothetical protein